MKTKNNFIEATSKEVSGIFSIVMATSATIDQSSLRSLPNSGFTITGASSAYGSLAAVVIGPSYITPTRSEIVKFLCCVSMLLQLGDNSIDGEILLCICTIGMICVMSKYIDAGTVLHMGISRDYERRWIGPRNEFALVPHM